MKAWRRTPWISWPGALQSDPGLAEGFKSRVGQHPAGIAIITVAGPEGPVGLTGVLGVLDLRGPPILGFSLQAERGSAAVVATADSFIVHFLDSDNVGAGPFLSRSPGAPRFGRTWPGRRLPTGEPRLTGVRRVLRAIPLARIKAGPALVFNAAVVDVLGEEGSGSPLVYHQRQFHGLSHRLGAGPAPLVRLGRCCGPCWDPRRMFCRHTLTYHQSVRNLVSEASKWSAQRRPRRGGTHP
ncbi:flavin reductase family protein [Kocuria rhizophila]|nr:flavin reductase family protein [Kocuria rhizophila]